MLPPPARHSSAPGRCVQPVSACVLLHSRRLPYRCHVHRCNGSQWQPPRRPAGHAAGPPDADADAAAAAGGGTPTAGTEHAPRSSPGPATAGTACASGPADAATGWGSQPRRTADLAAAGCSGPSEQPGRRQRSPTNPDWGGNDCQSATCTAAGQPAREPIYRKQPAQPRRQPRWNEHYPAETAATSAAPGARRARSTVERALLGQPCESSPHA
mmetsp:Transcript_22422/g.52290  ORF Transcript_22422/g.52290 Transcript_22422/m.52290 type:complete len:214 (+) Transcript_22422:134-775(+)